MIELLRPQKIDQYLLHLSRHFNESGRGQSLLFLPVSPETSALLAQQISHSFRKTGNARKEETIRKWNLPPSQPFWERVWGFYQDHRIVGHAELQGAKLEASLHRATLSIGIEENYRRKGGARALFQALITWIRDETSLCWLDLHVLSNNEPAMALYRSFGFQTTGILKDKFRIQNTQLDEISMSLDLTQQS